MTGVITWEFEVGADGWWNLRATTVARRLGTTEVGGSMLFGPTTETQQELWEWWLEWIAGRGGTRRNLLAAGLKAR